MFFRIRRSAKAVFYLDLSIGADEVSQVLDGTHQIRTMLLYNLDY